MDVPFTGASLAPLDRAYYYNSNKIRIVDPPEKLKAIFTNNSNRKYRHQRGVVRNLKLWVQNQKLEIKKYL